MSTATLRSTGKAHRIAYDSRDDVDSGRGTILLPHIVTMECDRAWGWQPWEIRKPEPGDRRCKKCFKS